MDYNKNKNRQLSYKYMVEELNNIKMNELEIGYKMQKILIPELTEIQTEIMNLFGLKIENMIKT